MRPDPFEVPIGPGHIVRGQWWHGGANWVVAVHDAGEDLDIWGNLPRWLIRDGYTAVTFDLPGHGLSDDPWEPTLGCRSVGAMVQFSLDHGAERIFLVTSGGSVSLLLDTASDVAIDALAGLSPSLDHDQRESLRQLDFPKLLLVGSGDAAALEASREFFQRCVGWTVMSNFPVIEQGATILRSSWNEQAIEQILGFLRDYRLSERLETHG